MNIDPYGGGGQVQRITPAQLVQVLRPLTEGLGRSTPLPEAVVAGFLVGVGLSPEGALDVIEHWRMSGVLPEAGAPLAPPPLLPASLDYADPPARPHPVAPEDLLQRIQANMADEISTVMFYGRLLEAVAASEIAHRETVQDVIRHAREDEQGHYRANRELYRELTGRAYDAVPHEKGFSDLRDGFIKAMKSEYNAFGDYREIYLNYPDERIRDTYFKLMTDELKHATFFNFALQSLR